MVPCSTYLVQAGWFDIFFPTNFETIKKSYDHIMGNLESIESKVMTHKEFLTKHSKHFKKTKTLCSDNPMLDYFENVKFFISNKR